MTTYSFSALRGDTFNGVQFTVQVNGAPLNLTGASLLCQFRKTAKSPVALALAVGTGLTVLDAANGVFRIDKQTINIEAGVYQYDIQMTLASGDIKTYVAGTMTVNESISRG